MGLIPLSYPMVRVNSNVRYPRAHAFVACRRLLNPSRIPLLRCVLVQLTTIFQWRRINVAAVAISGIPELRAAVIHLFKNPPDATGPFFEEVIKGQVTLVGSRSLPIPRVISRRISCSSVLSQLGPLRRAYPEPTKQG